MSDRPRRTTAVPFGRISRLTGLATMTAGVAGNMAVKGLGQLGRGQPPMLRDLLLAEIGEAGSGRG